MLQRCRVTGASNWYWLSWARPAILVAGKGKGGMFYFICFFTVIPVPLSSLSLFFISSTISFLPFSLRWHKITHKGWHVVKPQLNQSTKKYRYFSCFSTDTCCRSSCCRHLGEVILISSYNLFSWRIKKNVMWIAPSISSCDDVSQ